MTDWIDPQGRRWTNIVPTGRRVVAYTPDMHDRMDAADMAKRVLAAKSRPISEAMPEFFDVNGAQVVSIRSWREK